MTNTVYTKQSAYCRERYHSDEECQELKKITRLKELEEAEAESLGLVECKHCQGTGDKPEPDWSHYQALREAANE